MRPAGFLCRKSAARLAAALLLLLTGCRVAQPPQPDAVEETAERGPLRLTVRAAPRSVLLAEPIRVEITMDAPQDYLVRLPEAKDFGDLTVTSLAVDDPVTVEGGRRWRQVVTLESLSSGTLEIPPLVVAYARRPADPNATPSYDQELAVGTIAVEVRSALTSQDSPDRPRDIAGALSLPPRRWTWREWTLLGLGAAAVAALAAWFVRLVRRRMLAPRPPIAAETWALAELDRLAARDWFGEGVAREFYYRLTEIVRAYIERKFALAAPEMTTEEFLGRLARNRAALPYDALALREFLERCDLVKYAALHPAREDLDDVLGVARVFVQSTAAAVARAELAARRAAEQRGSAGAAGEGAAA